MAVLWSLTCASVILSLLQENNFSNNVPHRGKCRTEAVKHLSPSLKNLKNAKNYLSQLKFINKQNHWYHTKLCFNINLAMYGLPSIMKSSSPKTWQTSRLFLNPLQIQNLKRKKWGGHGILCPPVWRSGGTRPRVPHQIAQMSGEITILNEFLILWLLLKKLYVNLQCLNAKYPKRNGSRFEVCKRDNFLSRSQNWQRTYF